MERFSMTFCRGCPCDLLFVVTPLCVCNIDLFRHAPMKKITNCKNGGFRSLKVKLLDPEAKLECTICAQMLEACKFDEVQMDRVITEWLQGTWAGHSSKLVPPPKKGGWCATRSRGEWCEGGEMWMPRWQRGRTYWCQDCVHDILAAFKAASSWLVWQKVSFAVPGVHFSHVANGASLGIEQVDGWLCKALCGSALWQYEAPKGFGEAAGWPYPGGTCRLPRPLRQRRRKGMPSLPIQRGIQALGGSLELWGVSQAFVPPGQEQRCLVCQDPIIVWERLRRATWTSRPVQNALSLEHLMELLGSFYHIFLFSHPSLFHFLHDIVIYLSGTSFYRLIVKSCKFNIGVLNAVHAVPIIL